MLVSHWLSKLFSDASVGRPIVMDDCSFRSNVFTNQWIQCLHFAITNSKCKHKSPVATLDSSEYPLRCSRLWLSSVVFLLGDTSLVDLNELSSSAKLLLIFTIAKGLINYFKKLKYAYF
jgi:hypothetical protein